MKFPFLFLLALVLLGSLVFLMLASAVLVEVQGWVDRKRGKPRVEGARSEERRFSQSPFL